MEGKQQPIQSTKLVQKLGTYNYKLVIPAEVERKIRFACQRVWDTEWSGTLFFTHEGSFENNDLVIRCVDIYIMDIGTQAYTEFDMNPDVIAYMCENPELLDCQMGLIHSHNNMSTFFSGTDTATLKEEGRDRNNFVSLIVNNAGSYTAAITRRVKSKSVKESVSYEFFGDGEKHDTKEYMSEDNEIEWFYLNIEKEGDAFSFQDMDARFEEIKKRKAEKAKEAEIARKQFALDSWRPIPQVSYGTKSSYAKESAQKSLFEDDFNFRDYSRVLEGREKEPEISYGITRFNRNTIQQLVLQLVTGSITVSDTSKIDINKWAKSMPAVYQRRFGKGKEGMELFELWADTYTEFLVWYAKDERLEAQNMDNDEIAAICAHDIIEELTKLPENEYIKGYIDALQKYLIL